MLEPGVCLAAVRPLGNLNAFLWNRYTMNYSFGHRRFFSTSASAGTRFWSLLHSSAFWGEGIRLLTLTCRNPSGLEGLERRLRSYCDQDVAFRSRTRQCGVYLSYFLEWLQHFLVCYFWNHGDPFLRLDPLASFSFSRDSFFVIISNLWPFSIVELCSFRRILCP